MLPQFENQLNSENSIPKIKKKNSFLIPFGIILLLIVILSILGILSYNYLVKKSVPYTSQAGCEQETGKQCYLFKGLCQVAEAQNQEQTESNEKFLKDCLSKIGTWQPIETTSQTTSDISISDWATYKNDKYGFEIKYPKEFLLDEKLLSLNGPFSFDTFQHEYAHGGIIPKGEMVLTIFSQPVPSNLDIFIDNELGAVEKTGITVSGKSGKLVKFEGDDGPDLPGSELIVYVINGNKLWKIQLDVSDFTIDTKASDMFNQILSSFKFIESGENTISPISLTEYNHGQFSVPKQLQQGTEVTLKWTSNQSLISYWGDVADICLIGLNENGQEIEQLIKNKNICYPDMQLLLGTTTVSLGKYKWLVSNNSDIFVTSPKSYKLSIRVLDSRSPEGLSEWAGLISESTSNEFEIK